MDTNTSTEIQTTNPSATPSEEAVIFVNNEVLAVPTTTPMTGASKIMIDQATGMMVQDLQSFLKGFEQLGLIAVSRLANNILTYGSYHHDPSTHDKPKASEAGFEDIGKGNDAIRDLFKIISDYAEVKTKISSFAAPAVSFNTNEKPSPSPSPVPTPADFPEEDPEKKNF